MTTSSIRPVAVILLLVGVSIAAYVALVNQAQAIAYRFAPEYTPMSKAEILEQYSGYYWEGCTAADRNNPMYSCGFHELQHESEKKIVDLKQSSRLWRFEDQYVNGNAASITIAIKAVFGIAWFIAAALILRIIYRERGAIRDGINKLLSKLPLSGVIAQGKVKLAEVEHRKIKRLHESGLITTDEYEKRKSVLVANVHANLR